MSKFVNSFFSNFLKVFHFANYTYIIIECYKVIILDRKCLTITIIIQCFKTEKQNSNQIFRKKI